MLRWARKPFILMNTGSGFLIAAAASVFLLSERLFETWNTPTMLFSVGAVIVMISFRLMYFRVVDNDQP